MHFYVSAMYINAIVNVAVEHGANREKLLIESDMTQKEIGSHFNQIDGYKAIELIHLAIHQTGIPHLGIFIGASYQPSTIGILGVLLMSCFSLKEAIRKGIRYQPLLQRIGKTSYSEEADKSVMEWRSNYPNQQCLQPIHELEIAGLAHFSRRISWHSGFPLHRVEFTHAEPANLIPYHEIFGCPVVFDSDRNALLFDKALCDYSLQQSNDSVVKVLHQPLERELNTLLLSNSDNTTEKLKEYLLSMIGVSTPSLNDAADYLGLSTRTLRRKLNTENTSYSQILEELRKERALYYLTQTNFSISDISQLLGYSGQSSFNYAFRNWYQQRPLEYRGKKSA